LAAAAAAAATDGLASALLTLTASASPLADPPFAVAAFAASVRLLLGIMLLL
jgi:hypothetical protein